MIKKIIILLITKYQKTISPDTGFFRKSIKTCAFYPTCSEYSKESIMKHGVLKGGIKSLRRIGRCHPWQKNHVDLP